MADHPELEIVDETSHFITATLDGDDSLALHYSSVDASVFTKNPKGPRIIEYMVSIAPHLGGVVTGDEGDIYSSATDCGAQIDWDNPPNFTEMPWWKRELSWGWRVVFGLLLGAFAIIFKQVFFP